MDLGRVVPLQNGWPVERDERGAANVALKDALNRSAEVVQAAAKRLTSYAAWPAACGVSRKLNESAHKLSRKH